ncbi:hypothetical protein DX933_07610 [Ornithinibacillus gellani]|uniref:hypothetical protein n=1 Tax=Ornithinibacillus gellani TaxID=2293253 RepID=UPI000F47CC48|nr:hypothetical protein [Ornithinibacillus gellani]TQS75197.1 hypothetical protein DX933_07610 [Ornithinibacillus gellani]
MWKSAVADFYPCCIGLGGSQQADSILSLKRFCLVTRVGGVGARLYLVSAQVHTIGARLQAAIQATSASH